MDGRHQSALISNKSTFLGTLPGPGRLHMGAAKGFAGTNPCSLIYERPPQLRIRSKPLLATPGVLYAYTRDTNALAGRGAKADGFFPFK